MSGGRFLGVVRMLIREMVVRLRPLQQAWTSWGMRTMCGALLQGGDHRSGIWSSMLRQTTAVVGAPCQPGDQYQDQDLDQDQEQDLKQVPETAHGDPALRSFQLVP